MQPHTCLADHIRARRTDKAITQAQLALDTGLSRSAIAQYERGECFPALPIFARIAAKLTPFNTEAILQCLSRNGPSHGACCKPQEGTKLKLKAYMKNKALLLIIGIMTTFM